MIAPTSAALIAEGAEILKNAGNEDADFDARQLLLHLTRRSPAELLLQKDEPLPEPAARGYRDLIARRAAGEPLQYIIGRWQFYKSEFFVGPGVLIPRPETEELTDRCVRYLHDREGAAVYDLCAGSGCIGISIALACPGTDVYLFELSDAALGYLKKNIPAAVADRVHTIRLDIFAPCPPGLPAPDLIVSNPPYIPRGELAGLQQEVQKEPAMALDGGADGLDFYRRITAYWLELLNENGFAALECGEAQAKEIAAMLPAGFAHEIGSDSFGAERFVFAHRKPTAG